jgi:hypothetical protein
MATRTASRTASLLMAADLRSFRLLAQHPRRSAIITITLVKTRCRQRKITAIPNRAFQTEADLRDRTVREGELPEAAPGTLLTSRQKDGRNSGIQSMATYPTMKAGFVSWSIRCSLLRRPIGKPVAAPFGKEEVLAGRRSS